MAVSAPNSTSKTNLRLGLGCLGLLVGLPLLTGFYFLASYLTLNVSLGLDRSVYGQAGGPLGYALLGLGLGAAAGALAARHRYSLHQGVLVGAGLLGAGLLALALVPGPARSAGPAPAVATEAAAYAAAPGRVSCGACAVVVASGNYPAQNGNTYEAINLLRRDSATAWISDAAADADNPLRRDVTLRLSIGLLPGHRLVGLRLRNGYGKSPYTYRSFGRVRRLQVQVPSGERQAWTLPDVAAREAFISLVAAPRADSTRLTLAIEDGYPGDNHPEVALAWLVPLFEPLVPPLLPHTQPRRVQPHVYRRRQR